MIARALGDHDRPEKMALEPWLYRLALEAIGEMTARLQELESPVHLEDSRRPQNVRGVGRSRTAVPPGGRGLDAGEHDCGSARGRSGADRLLRRDGGTGASRAPTVWTAPIARLFCFMGSKAFRSTKLPRLLAGIRGRSRIRTAGGDCVRNAPSVAKEFHKELLVKTRTSASK